MNIKNGKRVPRKPTVNNIYIAGDIVFFKVALSNRFIQVSLLGLILNPGITFSIEEILLMYPEAKPANKLVVEYNP